MLFRQNLPNLQGKIRFIHAIPSAPAVDIYLDEVEIARNIAFADITCYENISPGRYEVKIYKSGSKDNPIATTEIDVLPKSALTANIVKFNNSIDVFTLDDANIKDANYENRSFLRFVNLSSNAPLMSLLLPNNIMLFQDAEYAERTGYYPLSPAIYDFKITFSSISGLTKYIREEALEGGKSYTIYILGLLNKTPKLGYLIVEDE